MNRGKKEKIKKITALLCVCALALCSMVSLSSCKSESGEGEEIRLVCTAFPQYDWIRAIVGESEGISLTLIVDNGSDLHSYQPTVADRAEISECDFLVTVGGASDVWAEEMLGDSETSRLIRLFDLPSITLRAASEEGVVSEHKHEDSNVEHDHSHHHDHGAYDEHIWLSLSNARVCVEYFKELLTNVSPNNAKTFERNADEYISKLCALENEYKALADNTEQKRLIFADRFPFIYLTADLNIEFCAAFSGCSTENNADFSTVTRLSERVREWKVKYLLITETSDGRLANGIIAASKAENIEILTLDSMQSLTRARMIAGEDYLSIMCSNLEVLRKALS